MLKGRMLIELFEAIKDPRLARKREHKLVDILVITFCGVFSRCRSWYEIAEFAEAREDFFKSILELPNGLPSHDTLNRVFQLLDFNQISKVLSEWLSEFQNTQGKQIIHIDGKFINGSNKEANNSRSSLGMVSAYASESGICLMSVMTRLKKDEGEKKSMEKLIDGLNLKKSIVTVDAAGATPTIVERIVKKKGDYLIALKANQKSFLKLCENHFETQGEKAHSFTTHEKSHGREDRRIYELLSIHKDVSPAFAKSLENQIAKWHALQSLIRVRRFRTVGKNPVAISTHYYFSSLKEDVKEIGSAIRSHWKIENNLHWVLDVHFMEDHCRTRTGYADANLALLRRLAISIVKKNNPEKKSINALMLRCSIRDDTLLKMLHSSAF
jgi:predicted transposase YbfD/YdcC